MNVFGIVAHPVRMRIIEILASGEHTSGNIAEVVGWERGRTAPGISRHLRILLEEEFVTVRHEETRRYYRLSDVAIRRLEIEVAHLRQLWNRRIGWNEPTDPYRAGVPSYSGRSAGPE